MTHPTALTSADVSPGLDAPPQNVMMERELLAQESMGTFGNLWGIHGGTTVATVELPVVKSLGGNAYERSRAESRRRKRKTKRNRKKERRLIPADEATVFVG